MSNKHKDRVVMIEKIDLNVLDNMNEKIQPLIVAQKLNELIDHLNKGEQMTTHKVDDIICQDKK